MQFVKKKIFDVSTLQQCLNWHGNPNEWQLKKNVPIKVSRIRKRGVIRHAIGRFAYPFRCTQVESESLKRRRERTCWEDLK